MKINLFSFLYLATSVTLILFGACQKEKNHDNLSTISNETLLVTSKEFLQSRVSKAAFENVDFSSAIIYKLKGATTAIRIPLKNLPSTTNFILLGSIDGIKWSGNYVKVLNSEWPSTFRDISLKLTSFDSTEVKINRQADQNRTSSMAAPAINTGVPGIIWLNFISSLNLTDPAYENWYYLQGSGGSGGSPPPLGSSNTLYYNPADAGNVTTTKRLKDSFPCVVKILDTISSEMNLN